MTRLRTQAGGPTVRVIAERSHTEVCRTTVARLFSGEHVPRWHYVKGIIGGLGGDADDLKPLWEAAYRSRQPPPQGINHPELRRARREAPEPPPPQGIYEYQQVSVPVEAVAETYTAHRGQGWLPLHAFDGGKGHVWLVMHRFTEDLPDS